MKLPLLASTIIGAASAFTAPSASISVSQARATTELNYEKSKALPFMPYPENLKGYVGDVGFDPLRFSDFAPMDFLREAEIKHGRICMLAWLGFVSVDLGFRIYPFPEAYEGLTSVTAHDALVEQGAMSQIFLWCGLAEVISTIAVIQMLRAQGASQVITDWILSDF